MNDEKVELELRELIREGILWLDKRNEARINWLATFLKGEIKTEWSGYKLADDIAEYHRINSLDDTKFIKSISNFWEWTKSNDFQESPLSKLSENELMTLHQN